MKRANHRTRSRAELRFESLESRQLLAADVLISEIMYHTATNDSSHEFIELHNRGDARADLSGWKITNGVEFSFPDTSVPANGYIAIASDVDAFEAAYDADVQVIGGWTGRLANRGETITIVDKDGVEVDRIRYADQGEWATRKLDEIDAGFQGWTWDAPHDGKGRSLELINPNLPNELGQNWSASAADGGTPGRANSAASMNTAPIATNVRHLPVIPNSTEPVTVYVDITDSNVQITPTLHYRPNATGFTPLTMTPVESADTTPGTTTYAATIHAVPDGTVMEFFIEATDDDGNSRRTPTALEHPIRTANFLYQVIDDAPDTDTWSPNDQPISYLIMREPERAMLADIGDGPLVDAESNAAMNATFIRVDGNGTDVRYNVSVRNRGGSSRVGPPNNYRINFPHDRPWDGAVLLNLNSASSMLKSLAAQSIDLRAWRPLKPHRSKSE